MEEGTYATRHNVGSLLSGIKLSPGGGEAFFVKLVKCLRDVLVIAGRHLVNQVRQYNCIQHALQCY